MKKVGIENRKRLSDLLQRLSELALSSRFVIRSHHRGLALKSTVFALQPELFGNCPIEGAVVAMAEASASERGAIFTRREVVDFILDLSGYTVDQPLHHRRLLEPSFGGGDFLLPAAERLLTAYTANGGTTPGVDLLEAICGVELHHASLARTNAALETLLTDKGVPTEDARKLCQTWLIQGDFLLADLPAAFDYVVGNPPYVRQEMIPEALLREYRHRYATIFDRADLYVPFIERSLALLAPRGVLGFICADRWMKNRYGRPLRELVTSKYHLRAFVDMVDTPAFTSDVIAYPGVFIIANEHGAATKVARQPEISADALASLAQALTGDDSHPSVYRFSVAAGGEPWIVEASASLELVRRFETELPTLAEAGCKVGIGVATGADNAFIGLLADLDVEDDRKLPLVMTRDIVSGHIEWRGYGVVNPFADAGGLVDLDDYPRLKRYLEARKAQISGRHVAQKSPANWYRTIDRIYPAITAQPKLLIPDIKGEAHIVHDDGSYYPHHNLYYITSGEWDLHALQAVLLSGIARLFIATYSTKMRGGYLRFQAQYLRRIRIPYWQNVPENLRRELIAAGKSGDQARCDAAVVALYGFQGDDWKSMTKREAA